MKRIRISRRFWPFDIVLLVLAFLISFSAVVQAQSPADPANSSTDTAKSAEALQTRIERARALIAAHRLEIAASELESVRATAQDNAVRNVTSIMLMSVYLEDGNYGRAEALLEEDYQDHNPSAYGTPAEMLGRGPRSAAPGTPGRSARKDESLGTYFALAGQAVNGARTHLARYRSFGINPTDATLPAEAASDLNRMRSLLERMIAQAREISNGRRAYDSLSLLEDVLGIRLSLAKDSEDQTKWEAEYASAREALASSQTQIASLGGIPPLRPGQSPPDKISSPSPYSTKRVSEKPLEIETPDKTDADVAQEQQAVKEPVSTFQSTTPPAPEAEANTQSSDAVESAVNDAGSLNAFATRKVLPRYPPIAKQSGASGLVRVYVIVEGGKVIAISRTEGPMLLRTAAAEAARQWSFQVVSIEGRPARLSGYIDFNFTL